MAKKASSKPTKSMEESLWDSANKLRGTVESSEYKHIVLSLIFLKFISDKFEAHRQALIDDGKEQFIDRVVALIGEYAPGFGAQVLRRELLTPVDIEQKYNLNGGHWHHGELGIDQSFMMRPVHGVAQYDTPIDGLFLCGAAAHPGGGITGVPGHNAAHRILAMEGRG